MDATISKAESVKQSIMSGKMFEPDKEWALLTVRYTDFIVPLELGIEIFRMFGNNEIVQVSGSGNSMKIANDGASVELKKITAQQVAIARANTSLTVDL